MSTSKTHGRRRAAVAPVTPFTVLSRTVAGNAGSIGRQAAVIAAASGLVMTSGVAAQASESPTQREAEPASTLEVVAQAQVPLSADATVKIAFERPAVATTPAPVVEAPKPAAKPAAAPAVQA
ncbi:MAG: hypothetical protein WAL27_01050, partial [Cellulosimicrobium cellulans]